MTRKKNFLLIITVLSILTVSVGATLAYLVAASQPVINTFTVGDVGIALTETTGSQYIMAPGIDIPKDPVVTVQTGSEECWLFVKVEKENAFDQYCTYTIADGWTALTGEEGIYYRQVGKTSVNQQFHLLHNDRVWVKDTLTEEQLAAITTPPTLTFTAYAIQNESFASPQDAWDALHQ